MDVRLGALRCEGSSGPPPCPAEEEEEEEEKEEEKERRLEVRVNFPGLQAQQKKKKTERGAANPGSTLPEVGSAALPTTAGIYGGKRRKTGGSYTTMRNQNAIFSYLP